MKKFWLLSLVLLLLLSACGTATPVNDEPTPTKENAPTTESAPPVESTAEPATDVFGDFTATDIEGNAVDASIFAGGKLTMVNIWATFCRPCISEMPDLGALSTEYADRGLQIVGMPVDVWSGDEDMLALAKEIVELTGADYLHILPSESLISAKLGKVTSVPETIFVDENGMQVGDSYVGSRSKEQWAEIIDELLELVP